MDAFLTDRLTLDGTRRTADGYLTAVAKVARTGIQEYYAHELGDSFADRAPSSVIRVYRPEDQVFDQAAMATFAHRPVTINHPSEAVTADNWRKYSVGLTGDEIARDGNFIRVPLALMDAAAIRDVESGKRELSMGYSCDLVKESGVTADGLQYDAVQRTIRGNHLAIVDRARGGSELKIGDSAVATKTITFDGLPLEVTDAAEAAINKLLTSTAKLTADLATANTQVGTMTATVATKDGEIVALKAQLADAALTPAKLDAAVAARAKVIDAAKAIAPTLDATGKTDAEIRKMAVVARLGDAATANLDDNGIAGAFAALSITTDKVRDTVLGRPAYTADDGDKRVREAHAAMVEGLKNPGKKAA